MWHYFNSTEFKIKMAHIFYLVLKGLRLKTQRVIKRNGVFFDVDLAEGIELSLFLFGQFQKHVTESRLFKLPLDAVIFDVGANIGSVGLCLARKYPSATIFAFEPTNYAFAKLVRNLQLNKDLAKRIFPVQTFVSSSNAQSRISKVFSSWRVDTFAENRHPIHMGVAKQATTQQVTIDSFVAQNQISRLDYLKIDTDGYELDVLKGAVESLRHFHPVIVFELSTYLLKERDQSLADFEALLHPCGYEIWDGKTGARVFESNLEKLVPRAGSTDLVAIPPS